MGQGLHAIPPEQHDPLQSAARSPALLSTVGVQPCAPSMSCNANLNRPPEGSVSSSAGGSIQRDLRHATQQVPLKASAAPARQSPLNSTPPLFPQSLRASPQVPSQTPLPSLSPSQQSQSPLHASPQLPSQTSSPAVASPAVDINPGVATKHSTGSLNPAIATVCST